jgi:hypothetical protein
MGNAQTKNTDEKNTEQVKVVSLEKMTDEELMAALKKETDYFFENRNTLEVLGKYSKTLTMYIHRCHKKTTECSMDKLFILLDTYNTPYSIELPQWGKFRVKFIRVPKAVEPQL